MKSNRTKKKEQFALGKQQAERFGIQKPERSVPEAFGDFQLRFMGNPLYKEGFTAEAKACKLCALAKKMGTDSRAISTASIHGRDDKRIDPAKKV